MTDTPKRPLWGNKRLITVFALAQTGTVLHDHHLDQWTAWLNSFAAALLIEPGIVWLRRRASRSRR